jgi:PAS domain S-box-containing protein
MSVRIHTGKNQDATATGQGTPADTQDAPASPIDRDFPHASAPPRYRSLLESTRAIPWKYDLTEDRYTHIDPQIEATLGHPVEAWLEPGFWRAHIHPDDHEWVPRFCHEAACRGKDHEVEYRMLAADGRTVWLRDHVSVIDGAKDPWGLQGFLFDISEQKQAQMVMEFLARTSSADDPDDLFQRCVRNLAQAYGARYAFIGMLLDSGQDVRTLAVWANDGLAPNFDYSLEGTPCKDILDLRKELIPRDAARLYPEDTMLVQMGVDSYFGTPLVSSSGRLRGIITVMDTKPMLLTRWTAPLLGVFATRVAAELERKDVTDRLRELNASLEQRVMQRTAELEAANQELKAFSYSVSHDLRAPLRAIDGFSRALLEDHAGLIDATGQDYLQRVRNSAQYMGTLIDDMLKLARVTQMALQPEAVNLSAMAEAAITQLRRQDPARNVSVDIAPDLHACGDPGLLRVMLENLLENAWKYTSKTATAQIVFDAAQQDDETVFRVRDNGAGFDMKYADKLFGAFQRLHRRDDFEGTGVGLATVRRIVHRHGGRVWAEAEPDRGARFYFTLDPPARPDAALEHAPTER